MEPPYTEPFVRWCERTDREFNPYLPTRLCAVHGNRLGGESPLWRFVIANH